MRYAPVQEHICEDLITVEEWALDVKQSKAGKQLIAKGQERSSQQCDTVGYDNIFYHRRGGWLSISVHNFSADCRLLI